MVDEQKDWTGTGEGGAYRPDALSGKPFTAALLAKTESEFQETKSWLRDTIGSVRKTKRPDTLEGRVADGIVIAALGVTMRAADRNGLKPLLPGEAPTSQTSVVAAFGLTVLANLAVRAKSGWSAHRPSEAGRDH